MSGVRFDESYGENPAENYERFFTPSIGEPLAHDLLRRASVQPNERVLDAACGTGILARLLSEVMGPGSALAGLDPNPAMLAVARSVADGPTPIQWYEAPAEQMPIATGSYDVVLCQMGLQFMPDRPAALKEMWRVLDRGGRLFLSLPGPLPSMFSDLATALERHVGPPAAGFVRQVFALHDVDEVAGLLRGAGFEEISVEAQGHRLSLPSAKNFLWQYIHSTPLSPAVSQMDSDRLAEFQREVLRVWSDHESDDGLMLQLRMVVASATKAES